MSSSVCKTDLNQIWQNLCMRISVVWAALKQSHERTQLISQVGSNTHCLKLRSEKHEFFFTLKGSTSRALFKSDHKWSKSHNTMQWKYRQFVIVLLFFSLKFSFLLTSSYFFSRITSVWRGTAAKNQPCISHALKIIVRMDGRLKRV